ncbi:hypothetical protein LTR94_033780, partial [Friedmanniomyces endolithicus]
EGWMRGQIADEYTEQGEWTGRRGGGNPPEHIGRRDAGICRQGVERRAHRRDRRTDRCVQAHDLLLFRQQGRSAARTADRRRGPYRGTAKGADRRCRTQRRGDDAARSGRGD